MKLFRIFISNFRNSIFFYWICRILEKFEMEGLTLSYSQNGEDLTIKSFFGKKFRDGFYIDVGCNNPIQKSNTFKLYLKNWKGLAIDGNENLCNRFKKIRKRDIVINALISDKEQEVRFYIDEKQHEYSSIEPDFINQTDKDIKILNRKTNTLESILSRYEIDKIDLLCVDVEGHDFNVLKGLNLEKYQPTMILVESGNESIQSIYNTQIYKLLTSYNYALYSVDPQNNYYIKKRLML